MKTQSKSTPRSDTSCTAFSKKQKQLMDITWKSSGFFWFLADHIACRLDKFASVYEKIIKTNYELEYSFLKLPKRKHLTVLHIGCGAYPLTDITLVQLPMVKQITGIDNNPEAVRLAREVVSRKKLSNTITIEHADGLDYPVEGFDIIFLSSCSIPKIQILQHVFLRADKDSIIIIRELDSAVEPIRRCIDSKKHFVTLIERVQHCPFPFVSPFGWQTFYVKKK